MRLQIVAGVDLGGTAVNYTFLTSQEKFLIEGLCECPSRAKEGPAICLQQIVRGLELAASDAGIELSEVSGIGLDSPGPASSSGVLSQRGSTNFLHSGWSGFDIPGSLGKLLGKDVTYLNDGNAGALWGHFQLFGGNSSATSVSAIIGTGLGGGVIAEGRVIKGRSGYGGELGHVLLPFERIESIRSLAPQCNCGRVGDLESLCSRTAIEKCLLPFFLLQNPGHALSREADPARAARQVRGLAQAGDPMCKEIFRVQAKALGLFFDLMINTFDPDALIVGGGALETNPEFQKWFLEEVRASMPDQREEQATIPIHVMPNGDTAGARGAAIEALRSLVQENEKE